MQLDLRAARTVYPDGMRRIVALLSILPFAGCSLADLRPATVTQGDLPKDAEQKGRAWLDKAITAQGGPLDGKQTVSLWLRDDWPSAFMRTMAMPWDFNRQLLRLDIVVGTDDGRIVFEEGDAKGSGWGLQNWVSYRFDKIEAPKLDAVDDVDSTAKFWIPTLAYFPTLAWRIREATYVRYIGEETIGGRTLVKVFATWGDPAPQKTVDQYIVYIDSKTQLIAGARFTVRDMMGSIVGTMKYSDYRDVDGFKFPFDINGVDDLSSDETASHRMQYERVAFDADVSRADLIPNPDVRATK